LRRASLSEWRTAADCGSSTTAARRAAFLERRAATYSGNVEAAQGARLEVSGAWQPIAAHQSGARQPSAARNSQ